MNNRSIILVEMIIIMVLLAIVAFGITSYIAESLEFSLTNINQEKALYMAQAGVMRAIVDFRDGGLWSSVQNNNEAGDEFYYHLGKNANFLCVNAATPQLSGKQLKRIAIKNIHATSAITITNIIVSWTFGGNITKVTLGSNTVWTGTASSPASLDISDFIIAAGVYYASNNDQIWEFSGNVPSVASTDVVVTFVFSDGSSYKAYIFKDGKGADKEFSITSTGEIRRGAAIAARRTLVATYDNGTNKFTSWEETQSHIIP